MASLDILHAFPGQESDESVFVFARPDPIAFLPTAFVFLIIFGFALLSQFALSTGFFPILNQDTANTGIVLLGLFELLTLTIFFAVLLDFYYDIVIVTDRRLVDIDQEMLFFRRISELSLENVEDATSTTNGFLSDIFNFGTVQIETAGASEMFIMQNIHAPREVAAIVINLSEQASSGVPEGTRVPTINGPIGVINGRPLSTIEELVEMGAISPKDGRTTPTTPTPPVAPFV